VGDDGAPTRRPAPRVAHADVAASRQRLPFAEVPFRDRLAVSASVDEAGLARLRVDEQLAAAHPEHS